MFAESAVDDYQVMLHSDDTAADVATVRLMPTETVVDQAGEQLTAQIASRLRERIGINFQVELLEPGALQRSEFKARRWIDERSR